MIWYLLSCGHEIHFYHTVHKIGDVVFCADCGHEMKVEEVRIQ